MEENDSKQPEEEKTEQSGTPESGPQPARPQSAETEKQAEYYKDLFLRKAAEFDNYRRRTEVETSAIIRFANMDLITAILPIVDDLERSLKNSKDQKDSPLFRGIELIYQKMMKILEAQGARPFETVGKEFDVHFHDALLQVPKEGVPPHIVVEEVEKGYMFHDKVLRHAKVIVSAERDSEGQAVDTENDTRKMPEHK
jgi:molecular chaperone GrpE